jgi:hypothetical protein
MWGVAFRRAPLALVLTVALLGGCAAKAGAGAPAALADSITRAVYADDYAGTTKDFDDATKAQVTRGQIGELSDKMHALGAYQGLDQTSADADKGLYEFDLRFASGHMTAKLRLDPSGKVGAYRVIPGAPVPGPSPTKASTG